MNPLDHELEIKLRLNTDAFDSGHLPLETAEVLRALAEDIERSSRDQLSKSGITLYDSFGREIGRAQFGQL